MVNPDPIDAELEALLAHGQGLTRAACAPALLIQRAKDVHEPLIGKRARFLMTSHSPEGTWLSYGWKDGLRIVSESTQRVRELGEPGIWVQEERDFYGSCTTTNRFAVGLSRVWIEQYVSVSRSVEVTTQQVWINNLNRDPNEPELRHLLPAEGYPDPVGRRVVVVGEQVMTDMRAVGPVRITSTGDLAVNVMAESDWYRWARDYPEERHASLRWAPATSVWIE